MMKTLVVVTDLGCLKAFRLDENQFNSTPRLELLEHFENNGAHERLVEQVSDQGGRFPRSGANGGMSDGERHNIELERRRRLIKTLAHRLNQLMRAPDVERCYLAASREMLHPLLDELEPQARGKITRNVSADLTKVEKADLLRHFRS